MDDNLQNHYRHVNLRLIQRYNIEITYKEYLSLNESIRKQRNAIFVTRKSKRLTKWLALVKNRWLMVYYDKFRNCVVTVIDKTNIEKIDELLTKHTEV